MKSLLNALNNNMLIITDYFDSTHETIMKELDGFNFIIPVDDYVNLSIFSKIVRNINKVDNTNTKRVYINPHEIYNNRAIIYTRPLKNEDLIKYTNNLIYILSKDMLNTLFIDNGNISLQPATLAIHNINKVRGGQGEINTLLWQYNPSITDTQNMDILAQKLNIDDIYIDNTTYSYLNECIAAYTHYKPITVIRTDSIDIIVGVHTVYGFDLSSPI